MTSPITPSSIQGVALQVTQLNQNGTPRVGTNTSYVTTQFMKFGYTVEYSKGVEIEEKAADGSICVYFQADDIIKRLTLSLEICNQSPDLAMLVTGGDVLQSVSNAAFGSGYALPEWGALANPNGSAIEVWSKAIVNSRVSPTFPYWRWVFPECKMYFTGERAMDNGAMANAFSGYGIGNSSYGAGARGDWPFETDRAVVYAQAATAPIGVNGYVTVQAAPSPVNQVELITITGKPTSGSFQLAFNGVSSVSIPWNTTAAALSTSINGMASIGAGNVAVTDVGSTAPVITLGTATSGGAFTAGSYFWVVTAVVGGVESVASNELTATLSANQEQPLNWGAVASATNYNIYRGSATGAENILVATVGAVTTYLDTGTAGTSGLPPTNHGPFQCTFQGALAGQPVAAFQLANNALGGGSFPSVTIAVTTQGVS